MSSTTPTESYLCCSPTSPRQMTCGTSSGVGQLPNATQPNTPHASLIPLSSAGVTSLMAERNSSNYDNLNRAVKAKGFPLLLNK